MKVELELTDATSAVLVKNLWPLYVHEISEYNHQVPNPHGLLIDDEQVTTIADQAETQRGWCKRADSLFPYLIRANGTPAGFQCWRLCIDQRRRGCLPLQRAGQDLVVEIADGHGLCACEAAWVRLCGTASIPPQGQCAPPVCGCCRDIVRVTPLISEQAIDLHHRLPAHAPVARWSGRAGTHVLAGDA